MKVPRHPQRFTCTIEVANVQAAEGDDIDENVVRVATTSGQSLLALSISREIGRHLTSATVRAMPTMDINGNVSVVFASEIQKADDVATMSLDQLVADTISPDMLEDEPDAPRLLCELRTRLLKSLELVETAIASLPKS